MKLLKCPTIKKKIRQVVRLPLPKKQLLCSFILCLPLVSSRRCFISCSYLNTSWLVIPQSESLRNTSLLFLKKKLLSDQVNPIPVRQKSSDSNCYLFPAIIVGYRNRGANVEGITPDKNNERIIIINGAMLIERIVKTRQFFWRPKYFIALATIAHDNSQTKPQMTKAIIASTIKAILSQNMRYCPNNIPTPQIQKEQSYKNKHIGVVIIHFFFSIRRILTKL